MRARLLVIFTVLWASFSYAQEQGASYTLDEAIAFALENNYSVVNAKRDLIDAQKQKWEIIATGLPQVTGAISYNNQLIQPVSQIPAEFFGGEPGTFQEVVFGQAQQANARATLSQQIFDGTYVVGVQATKSFIRFSQNNKEKTDLDIKQAVVEAYGNVLLSQESIAIIERNKATVEKNLYESQKLYENGLLEEENVEQLQITMANIESQLKNAIRLKSTTLQLLNLVMGIDIDNPTVLSENLDDLTQKQINFDLLETDFNIENNINFKLVTNLNEQRYYELKLAKSRALPTLNAFVNYGASSFSDRFNFLSSDQEWFESSILGFDLSIPIFSSFKRNAGTQRAKIAFDKAKTQLEETKQQIRLNLERSRSNYQFSIEQYNTAKANLALAERIENKNQIKYTEGLSSSFDLRQAQLQLYSAQNEYLQAMVTVINNKTALENIINSDSQ